MNALNIKNKLADIWSLIIGLKVTGKYFISPQLTVHYPRQTVNNITSFHGPVELVANPDNPERPKCIVCLQCASACPSGCLTVEGKKPQEPSPEEIQAKKEAEARGEKVKKSAPKELEKFIYDYTLCSLCGTCVETCPVDSLRFSSRSYLASTSKQGFVYDLLEQIREKAKILKKA
jgi:NADH-quinone oxidoreductase subunit I